MLVAETKMINAVGYEGVSIDRFLQHLIDEGIELIIDVRANPLSRKRGFSKTTLKEHLREKGIGYVHFRELGVPSSIRRQYEDIHDLLNYYDEHILTQPKVQELAKEVARLCQEHKAAIMCFEANPWECHRSRLAAYIENEFGLAKNFI